MIIRLCRKMILPHSLINSKEKKRGRILSASTLKKSGIFRLFILRFPLGIYLLPLLSLEKRQYLREQDACQGTS